MNHAYRLVWNDRLSAYVPAPEFARGRGKKSSDLRALSAAVLASVAVTAHALPGGGQVSAGQGSIAQSGSAMTVTQQSPRLAINWQSFGIGANESVTFAQPNASAIALNRVLGLRPQPDSRQAFRQRPGLDTESQWASVRIERPDKRRRPDRLHPPDQRRRLPRRQDAPSPATAERSPTRATSPPPMAATSPCSADAFPTKA